LDLEAIDGCIVSSVVPQAIPALRAFADKILPVPALVVGEDVRPNVEVRLADPLAVGVDRLVNALGGYRTYGGPLLVIDSGTALKFDRVAADGAFEGGAIAPGLVGSSAAMFSHCALLNSVPIEKPRRVVGRSTTEALQSGLYFGYLGLIEKMIARMREDSPEPLTVVVTGGVSILFEGDIAGVDYNDRQLTLNGLVEVWRDRAAAPALA
jgi:type III pantothenate kinase